jgi:hypothetical protein
MGVACSKCKMAYEETGLMLRLTVKIWYYRKTLWLT